MNLTKLMPDIMELAGVVLPELFVTYGDRIAAGGYDRKDDTITEQRFPLTLAAGPRALILAHFNKMMTSQEVEAWAAENGYEVALFDDLLAVGSHPQYKELQLQFPIIQLGSSAEVYSSRDVPSLRRRDAGRYLCLGWCGGSWSEGCRFLLVRKS